MKKSLSEKIHRGTDFSKRYELDVEDVKEFIRRLKENIPEDYTAREFIERVNVLAGEKLK